MSICDHLFDTHDFSQSTIEQLHGEKLNVQNELIWGLTYRNYKEKEKNRPMLPVHSPIDIPFKLCRAEMMLGKRKKPTSSSSKTCVNQEQGKGDGKGAGRQPAEKSNRLKKRTLSMEKPSLLDRNVWPQNKYMDFLSIPNPTFCDAPKPKKYKKRCELEPCPPRFTQLAIPNKRRVFANWKDYAHFLPTEMLMRYEEILHTDQNLEPREARYYYKKLDRQRRRDLKRKRRLQKKKRLAKENDFNWLKVQIDTLAEDIVNYIQDEPLFTLNYKQMLLSDGILDRLEKTRIMKKPSRKTRNHYKKTIIEVSDKFAVWIDTLTKFVDVQAVESDKDIPPLSISSFFDESEGEGEVESDYESSSEEELRDDQLFEPAEDYWGEDEQTEKEDAEIFMENLFRPGEGEDALDLDNMLNELDVDVLEKLIKILSNCSDDFLDSVIDDDKMPGVKYRDVLDRLKALRDGLIGGGEKPFLEKIMVDWAIRNDPDNVDDAILQKIHEVSGLLGDWLTSTKPPYDYPGTEGEGGLSASEYAEGDDGKESKAGGKTQISFEDGEDAGEFSRGTLLDEFGLSGPDEFTTQEDLLDFGAEDATGLEPGEESVSVLFEPTVTGAEGPLIEDMDVTRLDGRVIKGHKPSKVFEHSPDTVCCLSLKTWAVWLLEVTHNAHNWTKWMSCVIQKIKEYAAIVRGVIKEPNGQTKVLRKAEWRKFISETEESVVAWRQYSAHVKDLSQSIIDNYHGKKVNCCPKCLQDHLIPNVVVAHDTLQALTEAISCAAYWQRCLDTLVEKTCSLAKLNEDDAILEEESDESDGIADIEEIEVKSDESGESVYDIEDYDIKENADRL